jgi:hypothetical protein
MTTFPLLKTSAVAQYPATKALSFRNRTLRFLDGQEQRYREAAGPLRRWEIRLDALDESEAAAVDNFFRTEEGSFGNFAFTDPWDGTTYPNCSLASDELELTAAGEMLQRTSVAVVENRY